MEHEPSGAPSWEKWEKELAVSIIQLKEALMGDPEFHDGVKTLAWLLISNAAQLAGDLAVSKNHEIIKEAKLVSSAIERVLELITTDRPLTDKELTIMNVTRPQYEKITEPFKHKNRTIHPMHIQVIREQLEEIKKLGA